MTLDRKRHWETVYEQKSPLEVSWYQSDPLLSLELIQNTGIPQDAAIIDVGGGASILVDRLLASGYRNVSVLDLSAKALAYAQARLGGTSHRATWIEADITAFIPRVRSGGHVIIAAFAIGGPTQCSGLDIVQYDAEKLSETLGEQFRLAEERVELHITPANREQKFVYFRLVRI